jgi:LuxR family transcriptional regulator, maltose regulon positive regulatory protein
VSAVIDGRVLTRLESPGSVDPRLALVQRTALFERLSAVPVGGVVLVSAPAGSGKSVLVRSWAEATWPADRVGWVSVERAERDGQRFWLSVTDALARVTGSGEQVAPTPGFRADLALERLLVELDTLEEPSVLVIDDLHELRSTEALAWLELFLARLPRQLLVVLVTREDLRLGLHRLRLAGELTELRGFDLSFSVEETHKLLSASAVALSEASVRLLRERTEGWAAGLRLAAILLRQHPNPEQFVREFSGSERTVAGYLLAEVLERQPAEVRELLLRTSVLERVSGPLADFLTGGSGSERILQQLEDANAFVTSLDAGRSWFRYHQLFADLLQLELRRASPAAVGSLHRAAAQWFAEHGYVVEAVRHAQLARDWAGAARLLADHYVGLLLEGRIAVVRELLGAFPSDAGGDAELAVVFATARIWDGLLEDGAAYIGLAQRLADSLPDGRKGGFALRLASITLCLASRRADLAAVLDAMAAVQAALPAQPATEHALIDELRAVVLLNLGIAELVASRLNDARRDLEDGLELARRIGRPYLEVACLGHLAISGPWTGLRLAAGLELSREAVRVAEAHGWDQDPVAAPALASGAVALAWLGRTEEAEQWVDRATRVLHPDGEPGTELMAHHARGLLRLAQGRHEEALRAFYAAERMQGLLTGEHAFALAVRARLVQTQTRMGDVAAARAGLAARCRQDLDAALMRVAAAGIALAEGRADRAIELLAPVIDRSAPVSHQTSAITEALLLDAAARDQRGECRAAEASLERALDLAEAEGIVLPFMLAPVHDLLARLPRHRTAHGTLLRTIFDARAGASAPSGRGPDLLPEELSEAELRVVRYLPSNLKAPEIAAELCVSANTVRTHIRHIYAKLDSHDRNQAVVRARELGLLARSR